MKGKGIRSAIAASALSAVLCAGMLAGTTFAWFTDTVSSSGNSIMAGNLDITATKAELDVSADAQYTFTNRDDETETYALAFGAAEEFDGEAIIAETAFAPGMWNAKLLTVTNAGDLAVYVKLNFVTQDEGLADALWFDFIGVNGESVTGELTHREMSTLEGFGSDMEIPLAADESVSYILIYGMDKEAGNTYQGMNFNVDAYILARQQTEGARYDAVPTTQQGLEESLAAGGEVVLGADIAFDTVNKEGYPKDGLVPQVEIEKDIVLDLAGKTIAPSVESASADEKYCPALMVVSSGATLTINGNGTFTTERGDNECYGINILGGTVVINGGNFYGALTAVQVEKGTLIINGGFFDLAPTCKSQVPNNYAKYVVNCIDAAYKDGTAVLQIKGGTFVNFDPSANPEGAKTSYVADGYTVVSQEQDNGETWYTVVPKK